MTNHLANTQTCEMQKENALKAFSALCCEIEHNQLVSTEDCQYWVFEQGYKAAMAQIQALKN